MIVTEHDDEILFVRLSNLSEMPSGIFVVQPGIFRTWRGVIGAISATGFVLACAYLAYCVFARVFTH